MLPAYLYFTFSKADHKERWPMSVARHYHDNDDDHCSFLNCISFPRVWAALPFAKSKTKSHLLMPRGGSYRATVTHSKESLTQCLSSINFFFQRKLLRPANKAPIQKCYDYFDSLEGQPRRVHYHPWWNAIPPRWCL